MSLFWRRTERRSVSFQDVYGTGGDISMLGQETGLVPLYAAHRTIIDAVASTPLHGFRVGAGGAAQRLPTDPALIVPRVGSGYTWKAQCVASLLYDGNAFGLPTGLDAAGYPADVVWVTPGDVIVDDTTGLLPRYYYQGRDVTGVLIHVPWILPPGKWRGISPLKAFKVAWETGKASQQSARDWFVGGAIPSGHLKTTGDLGPEEADLTKKRFKLAVSGRDVFVSGDDWDYKTIGVPADEQRFVEGIKMTAAQVAAVYGLQPEDVGGEAANSLTYATVEGNERRQAQRVARPWCQRIEETLSLFSPAPEYLKFNLDANVRADLKTRMQAHEIALRIGVETLDEARALEDKAPLSEPQIEQWLEWWQNKGKGKDPAAGGGAVAARQLAVAEQIQKLYLGVGKVITAGEAREILRQSGLYLPDIDLVELFSNIPPAPPLAPATTGANQA